MWIPLHLGAEVDDALRRQYRAQHPWFSMLRDDEFDEAVLHGSPAACRERIDTIRREFRVDLPLLDMSHLDAARCRDAMERLGEHPLEG